MSKCVGDEKRQGWNKDHTKWEANLCFKYVEGCPCCREQLWHCKSCWDSYHHGVRDEDWIAPAFHGQPLFPADFKNNLAKMVKREFPELKKRR